MTETKELNHAEENAKGWMETITAWCQALDKFEDDDYSRGDEVDFEGDPYTSQEDLRDWPNESVLSLRVRSDWHTPGDSDGEEPVEYEILLSTGGPALRIIGELNRREPSSATMQHQNWGTPWTDYHEADEDDMLRFAQSFYFGD